MYTLLTGAKINMGDYLITERCRQLLRAHLPNEEQLVLPHWKPLSDHLEQVNASKAVIIMGGPGFQPGFYPRVYKLHTDMNAIKVPIVPLGLGWKGVPGDWETLNRYRFTPESKRVLERISAETRYLGCRDYMTVEALKRNGINNPLMTGCPVWYRLDALGKPFERPRQLSRIVVTPAQRPVYQRQSKSLLQQIHQAFPKAEKYCSFNRGITQEHPLLGTAEKKNNQQIADYAASLGYQVKDTSGDLKHIDFYDSCDVHVGYRVHSHLYFISSRKPSILLHEDGRGRGASEALNLLGVDAFVPGRRFVKKLQPAPDAVDRTLSLLQAELENGFNRFAGLHLVLDEQYKVMTHFIDTLPGNNGA
ncbi:MAG: polysaccharide pyruvyl transferase family protein [Deltaproteobacteria bacterium]|nr:polysaccharide pyruvyl transferase family protein [Deltaproteobacteria bacterium]MBN2672600.1 polysaccharide pyruvyl transferase family protein [Deltaproteobacteria bacterium]